MTYQKFESGHSWELNTCRNCGMVRKHVNNPERFIFYLADKYFYRQDYKSWREVYSRDGFKTIDTRAGECFKRV